MFGLAKRVIIITSSNPKWFNHLVFSHYNASIVFQLVYCCYSSKASTIWSNMKCCFRSYKKSKFASLITLCSISLTIQCNSSFAANLVTSTRITTETVNRMPCAPIPMVKVGQIIYKATRQCRYNTTYLKARPCRKDTE